MGPDGETALIPPTPDSGDSHFHEPPSQPLQSQTCQPRAPAGQRLTGQDCAGHGGLYPLPLQGGSPWQLGQLGHGRQVGKHGRELSIQVWLHLFVLSKRVTILSHPTVDDTHTDSNKGFPRGRSLKIHLLSATSLPIVSKSGDPSVLPFATPGLNSKTTIKTERLSFSFIFTTSFQG